ncbi:MAG: YdcF family protein [Oscillospiraceae bacterium]|jgi:uncharacterized SAM-binding protein YcdF (DUF218 family)|nr:YdcF family protein [Oscillospiraceae bacterium]
MKQKRYASQPWILTAAVFIVIGMLLAVFVVGHFYLGAACIFFGAIILIYRWFHISQIRHPKVIKVLRILLSVFLAVGTLYFAFLQVLILRDARTDTDRDADYIIVLGAGVNGTVPSLSLRNRLDATLEYMNSHPQTIAVVSGGRGPGEDITEAECMYTYLVENGIAGERIIVEPQATSTEENLRYSLERIRLQSSIQDPVIGIVSSEYHLHRAKLMAQRFDVDAVGIAGKTSYITLTVNYCIREAFGLTHYYIFGY